MMRPVSVSDLQMHLGYWLRAVSKAVSKNFARKVEAEGVTVAEWVFLRVLYESDGIAPSLLAERMGMTKGAISKLADRLLEKGHIERQANSQDGRARTLSLTPAARTLVPRLADYVASGRLIAVLGDWMPPSPGFCLYYPERRPTVGFAGAVAQVITELGNGTI